MAISPLVVAWLSNLTSREVLRGGTVLEMGPSDLILYTPAAIEFYLRRHVPADRVGAMMAKMFDSQGVFKREEIGTLYSVFGYTKYRSIDLADTRADWRCDLNYPVDIPERFDAIANFGTAEHVFNISEVFRSIHVLLRKGGVQLHVMPVFGDVNHGFYNIHPTVYFDLAKANDYVVEDIRYLDEINPSDIEKYKAHRLKTITASSVNRELAGLKRLGAGGFLVGDDLGFELADLGKVVRRRIFLLLEKLQLCRVALGGDVDDVGCYCGLVSRIARWHGRISGRTQAEHGTKAGENEAAKLHGEDPIVQCLLPTASPGVPQGHRKCRAQSIVE